MSRRFKNMKEVDDYLEKQINFDDDYRCIIDIIQEKNTCLVNFINSLNEENEQLKEENKYLKKRIEVISDELYCKDRKLEKLGVPIECCDKMSEKRFYITDTGLGLDTESDEMYSFGNEEDFCRLFDKLNEQQTTIKKLQDLCGQSDGENAKLRIENKRLKEMME